MVKVLVYGGTGSQARPTVDQLIKKGHQPIVLTRNAAETDIAGAKLVEGNMNNPEFLCQVSEGVDAVAFLVPAFLDSSDDAAQFGRNAIYAAVNSGVSKFVWNASGPVPDDESDAKKQILDELQNSPLNWLIFEPTTYMENWLGPWTAPSVSQDDTVTYPVLEHVKMGWLASTDVGKLVVAAIENSELTNKRYEISGIEKPVGPELAEIYSHALGRDIKYRAMSPEEMGATIDQAFGAGVGDRIAELYRKEQTDPNPEPKFHDMSEVLEALPVQMTTIESWVRDHADAFSR